MNFFRMGAPILLIVAVLFYVFGHSDWSALCLITLTLDLCILGALLQIAKVREKGRHVS